MKKLDRVELKTFNGTLQGAENSHSIENYWVLIGASGTVVDNNSSGSFASVDGFPRVLVKFDFDLQELELTSHNSIVNSLWIRISDLRLLR